VRFRPPWDDAAEEPPCPTPSARPRRRCPDFNDVDIEQDTQLTLAEALWHIARITPVPRTRAPPFSTIYASV
jgi:hypothetical protein